jgi:hypothetical protein
MLEALIIISLLWLWCYDLPSDSPLRRLVSYFQKPFLYLGLWHSWAMFAPEPLHVNRRLKALIRYVDGSIDEWRPLEPLLTNWFVDLLWLRHYKYHFSVLSGSDSVLWQPLCQWLIRQAALDGLKVQSIQLVREYQMVQGPSAEQPLTEWQSVVMYEESC